MQKNNILSIIFLTLATALAGQSGSRLFLDVPVIYGVSPNVGKFNDRIGLGGAVDFNVGTHYLLTRIGGGANVTLEPRADDLGASILTSPFVHLEAGAGLYRTNGNRCSLHHRGAFTAVAKAQLLYDFKASEMDYSVGPELGYFYIRDMFKNNEVFLRGDYFIKSKVFSASFGFKFFLNLKAERD